MAGDVTKAAVRSRRIQPAERGAVLFAERLHKRKILF